MQWKAVRHNTPFCKSYTSLYFKAFQAEFSKKEKEKRSSAFVQKKKKKKKLYKSTIIKIIISPRQLHISFHWIYIS